jgi:hypothetical protein
MSYQGYKWGSHQAWELSLALSNDEQAYKSLWELFANYEKKLKKSPQTFSEKLAIKGIIGWIDVWQVKMRKQGYYTYATTPMSVKEEVAKAYLRDFYDEMEYRERIMKDKVKQ